MFQVWLANFQQNSISWQHWKVRPTFQMSSYVWASVGHQKRWLSLKMLVLPCINTQIKANLTNFTKQIQVKISDLDPFCYFPSLTATKDKLFSRELTNEDSWSLFTCFSVVKFTLAVSAQKTISVANCNLLHAVCIQQKFSIGLKFNLFSLWI